MGLRGELSEAFGPIDRGALTTLRTLFDETEPLVTHTGFDDPLNPRVLRIEVSEGFETAGRFDVRWSEFEYYSFHYTEPELDVRFDRHPNTHSPEKHFHPPNASRAAIQSCIEVERVELVGLAVLGQWRIALERNDPTILNEGDNPP